MTLIDCSNQYKGRRRERVKLNSELVIILGLNKIQVRYFLLVSVYIYQTDRGEVRDTHSLQFVICTGQFGYIFQLRSGQVTL